MLNIALCEDNSLQRENLKADLEKILNKKGILYTIYSFETGKKLLEKYPEKLDILFLDIQMDELNGMETAKKVREYDNRVEIIFLTAVWDYIQKGYEVRAFRYLIKPLKFDNLKEEVHACVESVMEKRDTFITVKDKNKVLKIKTEDILFFETFNRKVIIHTLVEEYEIKISMNKLEKELINLGFFRCHTSYIVNISKVEELQKDSLIIKSIVIPVSKHRIKNLKLKLTSVLGDLIC